MGINSVTQAVTQLAGNSPQGPSPGQLAALRDANQIESSSIEQLLQSADQSTQTSSEGGGRLSVYA